MCRSRSLPPLLGLAIALIIASGCNKPVRVTVPPGLAQDEAKRITEAARLAGVAYTLEDPDEAAGKYRDAVTAYSEFAQAWNNLGVILMEQEKYLQAAEAFRTAAELWPDDPRALYNMGLLYDRRGYIDDARQYYSRAIERDNDFLPALRAAVRADSLLNQGSLETLGWIKRALMLEEDPDWQKWLRLQKVRVETLPSVKIQTDF